MEKGKKTEQPQWLFRLFFQRKAALFFYNKDFTASVILVATYGLFIV